MDEPQSVKANAADSETGAAAIEYLQSQLKMATDSFDGVDRKAALLPPFLAGAAGILIGSGATRFTVLQAAFLIAGLLVGAVAGYFAIEAIVTRKIAAGPDPKEVAAKMDRPLSEFRPALAGVIAEAIEARRSATAEKAASFNKAMRLAAIALLIIAVARLIGGLQMDEDATPAPSVEPTTAPASAPVSPPASAPEPSSPSPDPSGSPAAEAPALTFTMALETRARDLPGVDRASATVPPDSGDDAG